MNTVSDLLAILCWNFPMWGVFWMKNTTNTHLHILTRFSTLKLLSSWCSFVDEEVASLNMIKSAPVGPVAGGIMGCIMVLVLVVYAYRHQIHRRSHQHMSPLAAQGESDWIHTNMPTQRPRTVCEGQLKRKICTSISCENLGEVSDYASNQNTVINLILKSNQKKAVLTFLRWNSTRFFIFFS